MVPRAGHATGCCRALTGLIARTAHEKNRKRLEERATANRLRPDWSESDQSGLPPGPAA